MGKQKPPPLPTSFSLEIFPNTGISPQNFLTFKFKLFITLLYVRIPYTDRVPIGQGKLENLETCLNSKKLKEKLKVS